MEAQEYSSGVSCIAGRFFTNWATREAIKKKKIYIIQSNGSELTAS